ncbi:MAG: pyridoxamine 5'-phosphate oxidase family protein [Acidimicrobiales bacterium]
MKLTADMQRVVTEQQLGFVATVTADGRPNVSPKGTTAVWDDQRLWFADISSPGTIANLASKPWVVINVVDPITRTGYRFRGRASVHTDGSTYEDGLARLAARGSTTGRERVRSIVLIEVHEADALISPAYAAGADGPELARRWLHHHARLHPEADGGSTGEPSRSGQEPS